MEKEYGCCEVGDVLEMTIQRCENCGAEVTSEIIATEKDDNIGTTKPFSCPSCGWRL